MPNIKEATGIELYQKYNHKGDTLRLYKTKVLRKFLFPEIKDEKFVPENVVFDKIDQKYKMLVIKERLYYSEYQENGYTNNIFKVRKKNPIGYSLSLKSTAETAIKRKTKWGCTILYIMWCRKFKIEKSFERFNKKVNYIICIPISYILQVLKRPKFYYNMFE